LDSQIKCDFTDEGLINIGITSLMYREQILKNQKIVKKLEKKISELEEELTWKIKHRRVFHPSAFLYYLKKIRGDPPTNVIQECPFDN